MSENVTELPVSAETSKSVTKLFFTGLAKATVAMAAAVVAGIVIGDQINKHKNPS